MANATYNFVGAASAGTDLGSAAAQSGISWTRDATWATSSTGNLLVGVTNGIYCAVASTAGVYFSNWSPASADYSVTLAMSGLGSLASVDYIAVILRGSTASNGTGYVVGINGTGTAFINKVVSGTQTNLATATGPYTGSHTIKALVYGASLLLYIDGTNVIAIDDSAVSQVGTVGVSIQASANGSATTLFHGLTIAVADAASAVATTPSILASPGTSYVSGTSLGWIDKGYIKFDFFGTAIGVNFDVTALRNASIASGNYPSLVCSIDGGTNTVFAPWETYQFSSAANTGRQWVGVGLPNQTHTAEIRYLQNDESSTWSPATDEVFILSVVGDDSFTVTAPTGNAAQKPGIVFIFGDSIPRGYDAQQNTGADIARQAWPVLMAYGLASEYSVVGKSGQGWVKSATDGSPAFPSTWQYQSAGVARVFPPNINDLIVCQGQNDTPSASITTAVTSWITSARSVVGPNTRITIVCPLSGANVAYIQAGVAAYQAAAPSDFNVRCINPAPYWLPGWQFMIDGIHPTTEGHSLAAALILQLFRQAWDGFLSSDRAQTNKIGTNAGDSPNAVTAQTDAAAAAFQTAPLVTGSIASATATTVTLDSNAPAVANQLIGYAIQVAGQPPANIIGYTSSRVCNVGFGYPLRAWPTTPANGTAYTISGVPAAGLNSVT